MGYGPDSIDTPCPACGEVGDPGEYGGSCQTDWCRVTFYKDTDKYSYKN